MIACFPVPEYPAGAYVGKGSFAGAFLCQELPPSDRPSAEMSFRRIPEGTEKRVPAWSPQVESACRIGVSKGVDCWLVSRANELLRLIVHAEHWLAA